MNNGLKRRFPDLLIEAAFVFFAVLVALAAEEWREDRERDELADRALQNILYEMGENRDEISNDQESNQAGLERLDTAIAQLRAGSRPDELSVNYQVALTSSAAWETARMSQAVHFLDFGVMADLAEVYELQSLFERAQDDLMDDITVIGSRIRQDELGTLESVRGKIRSVMGYRDILIQAYDGIRERVAGGS